MIYSVTYHVYRAINTIIVYLSAEIFRYMPWYIDTYRYLSTFSGSTLSPEATRQ